MSVFCAPSKMADLTFDNLFQKGNQSDALVSVTHTVNNIDDAFHDYIVCFNRAGQVPAPHREPEPVLDSADGKTEQLAENFLPILRGK
jgi:hypothetical protein